VIRLDLLGDVLFSMPAVAALRETYPEARIVMLTLPYTAPLVRLYSTVDEVVTVDTNRIRSLSGLLDRRTWRGYYRTYRRLRAEQFDLCLSLSGRMASLCAFLSGSRRTVGYGREAYPYMLTDPVPGMRYRERMHEVEYVRRLAGHVVGPGGPRQLHVPVPTHAIRAMETLLEERGIQSSDRVAVIHAG
jgi:heptosyltransferase II